MDLKKYPHIASMVRVPAAVLLLAAVTMIWLTVHNYNAMVK